MCLLLHRSFHYKTALKKFVLDVFEKKKKITHRIICRELPNSKFRSQVSFLKEKKTKLPIGFAFELKSQIEFQN